MFFCFFNYGSYVRIETSFIFNFLKGSILMKVRSFKNMEPGAVGCVELKTDFLTGTGVAF